MAKPVLIVTCEHGGNCVPPPYRTLFDGKIEVLSTHRALDFGALSLAKRFAARFSAPLFFSTTTRLLVDLNRSLGNPTLFSEFSKLLSPEDRLAVLSSHYHPHRQAVADAITRKIRRGCPVLHLAVHTFTSEWHGKVRKTDIGLLYDPVRKEERTLCASWKTVLVGRDSGLCVRRNYPYFGSSDGLATYLRKTLSGRWYLGIELEVNNRHWFRGRKVWTQLGATLVETLDQLLAD